MVDRVPATDTYELRHRVLGRGRSKADIQASDDLDPDSGHYALRHDGVVLATGTVRCKATPSGEEPAWQIRGMAAEPELRGRGLGSAVLAALIHYAEPAAASSGATRVSRREGSTSHGFAVDSEPIEDQVAGEQIYMERRSHS